MDSRSVWAHPRSASSRPAARRSDAERAGPRGFAGPDVRSRRLTLHCPALPVWLNWIDVRGLRLGNARVNLLVSRAGEGARLEQFEREGEVDVVFSL